MSDEPQATASPAPESPKSLLVRLASGAIDAAHGRHTLFAFAFFVTGNVFFWLHRLDGTYIAFMGTLMGFVLGHSIKEDFSDRPR